MQLSQRPIDKISKARNQMVVQGNDFIRHARNQMTSQELDIIYYCISKIKPADTELMKLTFTVKEICEICGINNSGKNYRDVKRAVKSISDKSAWVETSTGVEELIRWFDTFKIQHNTGLIIITLSQSIKPFLIGLIEKGFYTQSELLTFLALRSRYSKRLYELLKSYLDGSEKKRYKLFTQHFEIDELKQLLATEKYDRYPDFERYVLKIAEREINEVTDISMSYSAVKTGRKYTGIEFYIQYKKPVERLEAQTSAEKVLTP